jgi:hypothetical protein
LVRILHQEGQETVGGLELSGLHQLLVYMDSVHVLGRNINRKKKSEALLDDSREVDLEVNKEKTKHMVISCNQNEG